MGRMGTIGAITSTILLAFLLALCSCGGGDNGGPVITPPGDGVIQPPGPIVPPAVPPDRAFPTSLHATRRGKITWYVGTADQPGFFSIFNKPIEELGCLKCHPGTHADGTPVDPATYKPDCKDCHLLKTDGTVDLSKRVSDSTCLKCHRRQDREIFFGYRDVHRDAGYFRCMSCHTPREMHGDGMEYKSWLEPGAMDAACERCHRQVKQDVPGHDRVHLTKVHCTACHTKSAIACYSCHFPTKTPSTVVREFVLLLNRKGVNKVYTGTMMVLTDKEKGKAFVAIAPYRAHTIVKKGRTCSECHNNPAVQEYVQTGKITVTKWNGTQAVIDKPGVAIPVPPDWRTAFQFAFVQTDQGPSPNWSLMKVGPADMTQMLYAEPLTPEQMQKMATPYPAPQ